MLTLSFIEKFALELSKEIFTVAFSVRVFSLQVPLWVLINLND